MDLTRRFVFRGNASAIAGQLYRPKTIIVDVNGGASSLGVSGGRSQSKIDGTSSATSSGSAPLSHLPKDSSTTKSMPRRLRITKAGSRS